MPLSSIYFWFLQALNVTNVAIELHRDRLCLKSLLARTEARLEGCELIVALVDDVPPRSLDYVTIRMQQGSFVVVSHARRSSSRIDWKVSRRYLVDVARHPRKYLENPDQLDFRWLKQRLELPQPRADAVPHGTTSNGVSDSPP